VTEQPLLSVVFTAYTLERLKDIFELLDSIEAQSYPRIEVIFVAERSTVLLDRVQAYVREKKIPTTRLVYNHQKPGLAAARNLGIKEANGDIVAFVDDDVVLFPDWAEAMVKTYDSDSVIGITGPALPLWENESLSWLPEEFYWIVSCTAFAEWHALRPVRSAWGMNMSFRREAFDYCHFSTDFGQTSGEQEAWKAGPVDDAEFSINLRMKTGKVILYNPQVRVQHKVYMYRLSNRFIRGQCYWQGFSKGLLRRTYRHDVDTRALVRERDLLRRIIIDFVPRTAWGFFHGPRLAVKKLALAARVLFYVALGFSAAAFPLLAGFTRKYFSS
jgi:glycosyltransferase involved in cell wall biosynthesis